MKNLLNIQKIIKDSKLTDLELERLTGVSRITIWRIRWNKIDPKLSTVTKIVEAIECYTTHFENRIK